ncbi:hypothetical protein BS47DRAFT_1399340 [Hydnum rufescens UP504]|uniref:Uncharacterized protein n=1 Tax=Hydnum rufescens UP504 TaxID=1448309 RepID=A0A9P6AIU5_9AGAM|nr:hypothetical protein BS47DRAFT_1399340 [Hydnum rufescens UP504]
MLHISTVQHVVPFPGLSHAQLPCIPHAQLPRIPHAQLPRIPCAQLPHIHCAQSRNRSHGHPRSWSPAQSPAQAATWSPQPPSHTSSHTFGNSPFIGDFDHEVEPSGLTLVSHLEGP